MAPSDILAALPPVVDALERLDVAYYVGGSVVSSNYGVARSTLDVDLVADLGAKHADPLVAWLKSAYYVDGNMISDAIARRSCFNVIHLPTMFKVDVFTIKDRQYDRAALGRIRKDTFALESATAEFFVAAPEDIVLSKLEWFRLGNEVSNRQWGDTVGVLKVQHDALDRAYLVHWARELGIADLLEKAWRESQT